ncbi:hypothetical protein [Flavobacterium sp. 11]|uniref:hypothetical protein n=1 Tax=Flavobacterium sp. 11 TaxID=357523 RepID=UPI000C175E02|nr:hypothetical protein [Flavobacterium sp. 11]PIF62665.1 hypothetical protein CLV00_2317 [Flavobacterium sp. 11]
MKKSLLSLLLLSAFIALSSCDKSDDITGTYYNSYASSLIISELEGNTYLIKINNTPVTATKSKNILTGQIGACALILEFTEENEKVNLTACRSNGTYVRKK